MNAHFSKNSCYSRYSIINEWPHLENRYLSQWRVDIEEESPVDVEAGELAKMRLIPPLKK